MKKSAIFLATIFFLAAPKTFAQYPNTQKPPLAQPPLLAPFPYNSLRILGFMQRTAAQESFAAQEHQRLRALLARELIENWNKLAREYRKNQKAFTEEERKEIDALMYKIYNEIKEPNVVSIEAYQNVKKDTKALRDMFKRIEKRHHNEKGHNLFHNAISMCYKFSKRIVSATSMLF